MHLLASLTAIAATPQLCNNSVITISIWSSWEDLDNLLMLDSQHSFIYVPVYSNYRPYET
jgi:hypothetical protein